MPVPVAVIAGIAFFMLLVIAGTLSFKFLAVLFGLVSLGMAIVFMTQGKDPKQAFAVAGISLLVAFLFDVGWTTIAGLAVLAFALWRFPAFKQHAYWLAVLLIGLILVIVGQHFELSVLGITP